MSLTKEQELQQRLALEQFYQMHVPCNPQYTPLLPIMSDIYLCQRKYHETKEFIFSNLHSIQRGQELIDIIKLLIRDYAAKLLQSLTIEAIKRAEQLWEIHYYLELISRQMEEVVNVYYHSCNPPDQLPAAFDCIALHFQVFRMEVTQRSFARDFPLVSRDIHRNFKAFLKHTPRKMLVQVLKNEPTPKITKITMQESLPNTKYIQQPTPQKKHKQQQKLVTIPTKQDQTPPKLKKQHNKAYDEIKEFESTISKDQSPSRVRLEPHLTKEWALRYQFLLQKLNKGK